MAHKDNKNSKDNKKAGQKTQKELLKMDIEFGSETRPLSNEKSRPSK